jgi:hypothetical protein
MPKPSDPAVLLADSSVGEDLEEGFPLLIALVFCRRGRLLKEKTRK